LLVSEFRPDSCVVAEVRASPNHGERQGGAKPDMLVLHYTGMRDSILALDHLCSPLSEVSAHYVVMEDGHIVQCVPESRRAWHAGVSSWAGETDINSCSIGIEIANPGHDHGYPDFPRRQIAAVIALCRSIFTRHKIPPDRVLAHSDVAPTRKKDPGEKFPWRLLHDSGVGLWVKPAPITATGRIFVLGDRDPEVETLQMSLRSFGYGVEKSGNYDAETMAAVAAFQRHYRPQRSMELLMSRPSQPSERCSRRVSRARAARLKLASRERSHLALHYELGRSFHQPLPRVDIFAHESFVGRGRGDFPFGIKLDAAGNA
jgi:N-acetylmuramoyl-L-alanine amidase